MLLGGAFVDLLPSLIALFAFTIVGSVVILRVRRNTKKPPDTTVPFSLHELRKMRDEGSITEQEYVSTKQALIERLGGSTTDSHKNEPNER